MDHTEEKGPEMIVYQLKLDAYFFNIIIYGGSPPGGDSENFQYVDHDLSRFGIPGAIRIGVSPCSLTVAARVREFGGTGSLDHEPLTKVEVYVDETAVRRDDAFFEYAMPLATEGLGIAQVVDSDVLPIVDVEEVYIPVPWVGSSTIQLIAPDGFQQDREGNYFLDSLRIVVTPELPQP